LQGFSLAAPNVQDITSCVRTSTDSTPPNPQASINHLTVFKVGEYVGTIETISQGSASRRRVLQIVSKPGAAEGQQRDGNR